MTLLEGWLLWLLAGWLLWLLVATAATGLLILLDIARTISRGG
jgi:hypothetical protein